MSVKKKKEKVVPTVWLGQNLVSLVEKFIFEKFLKTLPEEIPRELFSIETGKIVRLAVLYALQNSDDFAEFVKEKLREGFE